MILPIYTYGHPILRQTAAAVQRDEPDLNGLIANMFETMYTAEGVGLAAPQIGLSIRLLVIDARVVAKDFPECSGFKRVMINPLITESSASTITLEEGCLSFPGIHEKVVRSSEIRIKYLDAEFVEQEESLSGYTARVVQHECEHLEGHIFVERIAPLRRHLNKGKLNSIKRGTTKCAYLIKPVGK
jgi:peptide deformylase